jgi:predicted acetyltransferase
VTEQSGPGEPERTLALLWRKPVEHTRGRKPSLTVDRIVGAAIAVADRDGLEAMSMAAVAAETGVSTMTLYTYVPGKAELIDPIRYPSMNKMWLDGGYDRSAAQGGRRGVRVRAAAPSGRNRDLRMPRLIPPDTRVQASFIAAMEEFRSEGRGDENDHTMLGREIRDYRKKWPDPDEFAAFVAMLRADALEETPRPHGFVPATTLWWVESQEYLGRLAIRHRLTPSLFEMGGHIGYDVRTAARRRGHATAMLREALPIARSLGIDAILITCDVTNVASRKVIEASGGILEDQRGEKLRFWIGK